MIGEKQLKNQCFSTDMCEAINANLVKCLFRSL
jgi:hypothetical protein